MSRYIVFDVETPNYRNDRISAIGVTVVEDSAVVNTYYTLVNPETFFDPFNIQLTGITPEMAGEAPAFPEVWRDIEPIMNSGIPVAHNAVFDLGVLRKCLHDYGIIWKQKTEYLCTVQMGRRLLPGMSHRLNVLADYYQIHLEHHHADSDSQVCAEILLHYIKDFGEPDRFIRWYTMGETGRIRADESGASGSETERTSRNSSVKQENQPEFSTVTAEKDSVDDGRKPDPTEGQSTGKDLSEARKLLTGIYGYQTFRPGQKTIIESVLQGKDVLGVMPTGSGKSICYQIPAMILPGITLVISPLISLMKDQVTALRNRGISAACLNSSMDDGEYSSTVQQAVRGAYRILYAAPERLSAPGFLALCAKMNISFVAVDEAHCVSQWGQDFRPSYLKIKDFIAQLPIRPVLGAFTATATPHVREDIHRFLGLQSPVCVSTGFDRPNLSFSVYHPKDRDQTLQELLQDRYRQSGIVYCGTRKATETVCRMLNEAGFSATRYHAGLSAEERTRNQEDFLFDRKRVMVATNAFGMGIDKSNVSYVIHYNMPKSLEAYYQEAGRAGRDGCDADCILLYSPQDIVMARWLIQHSEPNPDLTQEEQLSVREKEEERLKWMTFYARSGKCLRHDILRYFGEKAPDHCDNCSNCVPDCEHQDITTEAQMILSCIARTNQSLTGDAVMALLRGIEPEDLPDHISVQGLSTFGLMKDTSPEQLREEVQALCDQGFLDRLEENVRILRLNQRSRDVLFQHQRVVMRRSRKKAEKNNAVPEDLLQALRQLRYEISGREFIAASTLLPDSTLQDICAKLPRDRQQLAEVEGMGVYKARRYGDEILKLVERYAPEKKTGKPAGHREKLQADGKTEAYQPWSTAEDNRLADEYRRKVPLAQIAEEHRRTRGAILSRLKKLEMV